jgi:hypothetical protein
MRFIWSALNMRDARRSLAWARAKLSRQCGGLRVEGELGFGRTEGFIDESLFSLMTGKRLS